MPWQLATLENSLLNHVYEHLIVLHFWPPPRPCPNRAWPSFPAIRATFHVSIVGSLFGDYQVRNVLYLLDGSFRLHPTNL
jgi:hypothetical protein